MLSVPTLWTVFVVNFLAVGLIWAYVMRSYPNLEAARCWTASCFTAARGAVLAMLRVVAAGSLLPLLAGGVVMIFAACLAAMGIKRFYGQPVSWRATFLITGLSGAGLVFFIAFHDSVPMRVLVYSVGQSLPFALTLKLLLSPQQGHVNPGARLAGVVAALIIAIQAARAAGNVVGSDFWFTRGGLAQAVGMLARVFPEVACQFGCLLVCMDRLRNEAPAL